MTKLSRFIGAAVTLTAICQLVATVDPSLLVGAHLVTLEVACMGVLGVVSGLAIVAGKEWGSRLLLTVVPVALVLFNIVNIIFVPAWGNWPYHAIGFIAGGVATLIIISVTNKYWRNK